MIPQVLQPSEIDTLVETVPVSIPFRLPDAEENSGIEELTSWEVPDGVTWKAAPPKQWVSSEEGFVNPVDHPTSSGPIDRTQTADWVLVVMLLALGILGYLRTSSNKRLQQLVNAFVSNRFVRQMLREEQAYTNRATVLLTVNYWAMAGLFITQIFQHGWPMGEPMTNSWLPRGPLFFFLAFGGVAGFYLVKFVLIKICGWLFNILQASEEYLFNFQLFATVQGLVLIPVVASVAYLDWAEPALTITVGAFLSMGFLIVRLFKGIYLGISTTNFSWFYIIVYICSLEILPLLILAKPLITIVY